MAPGTTVTWKRPLTPGVGRLLTPRPTRVVVRTEQVEVLGPVQFEPGMLRVRRADGSVVRALIENLHG